MKTKLIAEIGISHNGDINIAKKLIDIAADAGFQYVKFQKRNPDDCVPEHQKNTIKKTPWGDMTYLDYKKKIEFGYDEYETLFNHARKRNVIMFSSAWDIASVDFLSQFGNLIKIPSALLTNDKLLEYTKSKFEYRILSTGMSTEAEIMKAAKIFEPQMIMHTNSTYPCTPQDLNLGYIKWLKENHFTREIGYSGHEFGLTTTVAAVLLGAKWIERHITLDRSMWGSDQLASIEPTGMFKLVKMIKEVEEATSSGYHPRRLLPGEEIKKESLRGK